MKQSRTPQLGQQGQAWDRPETAREGRAAHRWGRGSPRWDTGQGRGLSGVRRPHRGAAGQRRGGDGAYTGHGQGPGQEGRGAGGEQAGLWGPPRPRRCHGDLGPSPNGPRAAWAPPVHLHGREGQSPSCRVPGAQRGPRFARRLRVNGRQPHLCEGHTEPRVSGTHRRLRAEGEGGVWPADVGCTA